MSYSVRPHRWQPTRLHHPWDSPGRNIGVGCHFILQCIKAKSESEVAQSCPTPSDPMDCSLPGSSMGFARQKYWSELPLPSPSRWQGRVRKELSLGTWLGGWWLGWVGVQCPAVLGCVDVHTPFPSPSSWISLVTLLLHNISSCLWKVFLLLDLSSPYVQMTE